MRKLLCIFLISLFSTNGFSQTNTKIILNSGWKFRKAGDRDWLPADIPGCIHTDLFNNKKIPDPFFSENEKTLQWIENENWEYQKVIKLTKKDLQEKYIELQFEGLDTYAKIFVNDSLVLKANNAFRSWNVDIKKYLHAGENDLLISFESAVKKGKEEAKALPYTLPGDEKIFTRKAQYQYGWDWGPRFVTCGITKTPALILWTDVKLLSMNCIQKSLNDSFALLDVICEIESDFKGDFEFTVAHNSEPSLTLINKENTVQTFYLKKGKNIVHIEHPVHHPKRWWCNGLGESYLYPLTVSVSFNEDMLDKAQSYIGLRTLELVQQKDPDGKSFYFKLNEVPVFMKGANWIPTDNFTSRTSHSKYTTLITAAADAHMNMLRVWGGGTYEDDEFYDLCDMHGILVWQDFMFACAMYPGNPAFIENIKEEAIENVKRLQKHPSLALWCGNNEIKEGWYNWGWQKQYSYSQNDSTKIWKDYQTIFETLLPEVVSKYDEGRAYWPSSPAIGWGHKESLQQGDSHYWGVWWGMEPFDIFRKKTGRFMSEYGFQGMPALSTFKKFCDEKDLSLTSGPVKNHQKHPTGYQTIQTYMERDYKTPKRFEDYIYVSQLLQADGLKSAMEAHRRAKPYCMGTLYWQFNDCWPVTSWSSIDYYGNWKAAHYQAQRSFENILVSIEEKNDSLFVYVVSDSLKTLKGSLNIKVMDFAGKIFSDESFHPEVPENRSVLACSFSVKKITTGLTDINQKVFCATLTSEKLTRVAYYYFVKPKDLLLKKPVLSITPLTDHSFQISTDILAKNVCLQIENQDVNFSDNFFDLLPGEKKNIFLQGDKTVSDLKTRIKIKTLFDSF